MTTITIEKVNRKPWWFEPNLKWEGVRRCGNAEWRKSIDFKYCGSPWGVTSHVSSYQSDSTPFVRSHLATRIYTRRASAKVNLYMDPAPRVYSISPRQNRMQAQSRYGQLSLGVILTEDPISNEPLPSYIESRLAPRCEEDLRNPAPFYALRRTAPLPSGADKLAGLFASETRRMFRKVAGWVIICLADTLPVSTVVHQGVTKTRRGHRHCGGVINGVGRNRDSLVVHVQIGMRSHVDEIEVRNRDRGF